MGTQTREEIMRKKVINVVIVFGIIFLSTSILGIILGNFLDRTFSIEPFGTLVVFAFFYAITWIIAWKYTKSITNSMKATKLESKKTKRIS